MKKKFRIPVYWTMYGQYEIEAETQDEAIDLANELDMPEGEYSDGSFEISYENIEEITPIFVFGSNLVGRHGLGAARRAHEEFGAIMGKSVGRMGDSYAIPTKDKELNVLPLDKIKPYIEEFIQYAKDNEYLYFYVTKIGCGLAGYTEEQMAPLFEGCPANCELRFFKEEELI